eukprot:3966261-Prymnesium_polylepis.1
MCPNYSRNEPLGLGVGGGSETPRREQPELRVGSASEAVNALFAFRPLYRGRLEEFQLSPSPRSLREIYAIAL